jgi:prophage tail gpP-like protein
MNLKVKNHFDVEFFNEFTLDLRYDSVGSTFSFSLFFDPDNEYHKVLWEPSHYHQVSVEHNGELLITGFVLSQKMSSQSSKQLSSISGYSLTGVLEDCQIPPELYPLQSDGRTLREIAQRLMGYFGIDIVIDTNVAAKVNSVFDKTTASETTTIKQYLTSMASQKNIVLSHTPKGELLFTQARTQKEVSWHFTNDMPNTSMELTFNGQPMHSSITLQKQASAEGGNAGEVTIRNPYVPFVKRPKVKSQSSGTDNDTGDAARKALSEELKNITLVITTSQWEIGGEIVKPNNVIAVTNPEIYLYNKTNWFVESVSLKGNEKQTTATLTCVLPEVFNEDEVINIFEEMVDWRDFNKRHGI